MQKVGIMITIIVVFAVAIYESRCKVQIKRVMFTVCIGIIMILVMTTMNF